MKRKLNKKVVLSALLMASMTTDIFAVPAAPITQPNVTQSWAGKKSAITNNSGLNQSDDTSSNSNGNYVADIGDYLYGLQYDNSGEASATLSGGTYDGLYISARAGINVGPRIQGNNWATTYIPMTPNTSLGATGPSTTLATSVTGSDVTLTVVNAILNAGNKYAVYSDSSRSSDTDKATNPGYTPPTILDGRNTVFSGLRYNSINVVTSYTSVDSQSLNNINPHSLEVVNDINQDAIISQFDTLFLAPSSGTIININATLDIMGGHGGNGGAAGVVVVVAVL